MSPRMGLDINTIVLAAADLANEQGYGEVTLATLAKRLNIRPPSLYNHVEGLSGLRKSLAIYGIQQLYSEMEKAATDKNGDEAVHALGWAYVHFVRRRPGLYEATLGAPDNKDSEVQHASKKVVDLVLRVLATYGIKEDEAVHAVRGLRSICHGFASLEQRGGFGIDLDVDTSFRLLIDTFLAGIHSRRNMIILQ